MGTSRLKVILVENDITIKELAAATGLGYSTLTAIINGRQRPYIENAQLIADALGLHIDRCFPNLYNYGSIAKRRTKSS